jgi:hypothetical protein
MQIALCIVPPKHATSCKPPTAWPAISGRGPAGWEHDTKQEENPSYKRWSTIGDWSRSVEMRRVDLPLAWKSRKLFGASVFESDSRARAEVLHSLRSEYFTGWSMGGDPRCDMD